MPLTRFLPAAVAAILAATDPLAAQDGYRYRFTVRGSDHATGTTEVAGGRARIEVDDPAPDRQYLLVDNASHAITIVRPSRNEYSVIADTTFQRIAGAALAAVPTLAVDVSDVRVASDTLGPGERVAGHPTSRYRLTQEFTVAVGVLGFEANRTHQRVTTDYWIATDLALPANPLLALLAQITTVLAQTNRDFAHRTTEALRPFARGTPLKVVVQSESRDERRGGTTTKSQIVEVTSLERARIDPARLTVPAGYERKDVDLSVKLF